MIPTIPTIQPISGAPQPEIKEFLVDRKFIPQFHEKPYVFEGPSDWHETNCCIPCTKDETYFVKVNDSTYNVFLGLYTIGTIKYTIGTFKEQNKSTYWALHIKENSHKWVNYQVKTLAEAVEICLTKAPFFSGTHYFKGIIDTRVICERLPSTQNFNEYEILHDESIGTYFIVQLWDNDNPYKAFVKLNEREIGYLYLLPDSVQVHIQVNVKLNQSEEKRILSNHPNLTQISLCQSLLDITILKYMSEKEIRRSINSWTPEFLKGIKHISYIHENRDYGKGLIILIELLLHLAKIECISIKFCFENTLMTKDVASDNFCRQVLSRMRRELQGESLNWAIDNFLEVVFSKSMVRTEELTGPLVDTSWHEIYNNEETEPNVQIQLRDTSKIIHVHNNNLARFSPMLKACFYGPYKEKKDKPITFNYSDSVVENFLLICYGYSPDFSKCDPIELIKFADYLQSSQLMDVANQVFNTRNIDSQ